MGGKLELTHAVVRRVATPSGLARRGGASRCRVEAQAVSPAGCSRRSPAVVTPAGETEAAAAMPAGETGAAAMPAVVRHAGEPGPAAMPGVVRVVPVPAGVARPAAAVWPGEQQQQLLLLLVNMHCSRTAALLLTAGRARTALL